MRDAIVWLDNHNKRLAIEMQAKRRQNYNLATLNRLAIVSAMSKEVPWPDYYELYPDDKPEGYDEEQAMRAAKLEREQDFAALKMAAAAQESKR